MYVYFVLYLYNICIFSIIRSAPAGAPADGGNQPPNLTSNRRLQQTQAQVDEVSAHVSANPKSCCQALQF